MMYRSRVEKMSDNPTRGKVGTDGLFEVWIEYNDSNVENWKYYESIARNVPFEEGLELGSRRAEELNKEARNNP
jgi:16S rRNA G1207 methylase RsmC